VPDVLLDRVQLGIQATIPVPAVEAVDSFCAYLARERALASRPRPGRALGSKLRLGPVDVELRDGGMAVLTGELHLAVAKNGCLQVRSTSWFLPNVMRAVRARVAAPLPLPADGSDNLVAAYPDYYPSLLVQQLEIVGDVVNAVVLALASAAGVDYGRIRGRVWVKAGEITRDYPHPDARGLVRALKDMPISGAGDESHRHRSTRHGNELCVAWHQGAATSPERKVYAKDTGLVRVEIALRSRRAVKRLLGHSRSEGLLGCEAVRELFALASSAAPLLDEAADLITRAVEAPPRGGADLVLAFAPLVRLAAPAPRAPGAGGRPPGGGVAPLARLAVERLVAEGRFDMRGRPASDAVLGALKEMLADGALCAAAARPRLFTVAPALEAARQALAGVRAGPPGGAGP
jgi:hypothetical protein